MVSPPGRLLSSFVVPPGPDVAAGRRPSFSIVVAAYQAAETIGDALASAFSQTYAAQEIVVCDDGSTDGLERALEPFRADLELVTLPENRGEAAAKNAAVRAASGDFVAILDADDRYMPERLEALGALASARPDLDILTTDAFLELDGVRRRRVYEGGWTFEVEDQRRAILQRNFVFGLAAVRRERLLSAGGFDEAIRWTTDWDCWARLILDGARAGLVDEPLAVYRLRDSSLSADRRNLMAGRLRTLEKAAAHPSLSASERRVVASSIVAERRELEVLGLRQALVERSADARRRALGIARAGSFPRRTRLKAAVAAAAPRLSGRLLRRRLERRWTAASGIEVERVEPAGPNAAPVARRAASIRRVDARFVAPSLVRTAAVFGDLAAWREGLQLVGVTVSDDTPPDLAVAPRQLVGEAVSTGAEMVAVEGGGGRALARAGYAVTRYLPRPGIEDPTLVIALDHPAAARYAALHASGSRRGWKRARNAVAAALLKRHLLPAGAGILNVGLRRPGPPLVVAAAHELGVPNDAQWFLSLGRGDQLSRNVFQLFEPHATKPSWVLKFVRTPGYREPFERDERGLRLAESLPVAAAHAPRLVGRFTAEGIDASLETAAHGEMLLRLLTSDRPRTALRRVDEIAQWIVDLGAGTLADPDALEPERRRLLRDVIPRWTEHGATEDLVLSLPSISPVLQHNDLGSWNILLDDRSFTAVDWESAREHGLPLWDVVYFLTDALATIDRAERRGWDDYLVRLYRGDLPHSALLFRWIRRAVEAAAVPTAAVGSIVTLGWLHHGLSHQHRGALLGRAKAIGYPSPPPLERVAALWLETPGLGPTWARWQRG